MNAAELIRRGAVHHSDRTAVIWGDEQLSFAQVNESANRLAHAMSFLGLAKGDRVAFLLANSLQSVEIDFAMIKVGLVRVPLNTRLSEQEHRHMINETGATALIYTREFESRVEELRAGECTLQHFCQIGGTPSSDTGVDLDALMAAQPSGEPEVDLLPEDLCTLQYTSGTTGTLKAAVHTQGTWAAIALNILTDLDIRQDDIMLHAAPMTHATGTLILPHWLRGAANAILSGFNPQEYLQAVHTMRPTTLNLVPTMVNMLLSQPNVADYSFDSVRSIIYGASPMPRETLRQGLEVWGRKFVQYYGQTESPLILTLLKADDHGVQTEEELKRLFSCGRVVPTAELRILGAEGQVLPTGEIGEITVRSSQSMVGYWQSPELTHSTVMDGWIRTRDMGYVDEQGYVFLVDRKSDMIISGGFNIYPREVEDVLYQHPAVLEAAVVGIPDEQWGESVKAFVVLRPGQAATADELIAFCRERLASYKKPRVVEFADALPKSAVGKVVRRILRDPHWVGYERRI